MGDGPESVTACDFDGDGDVDLVTANRFSDDLSLYSQTAPGVFELSSTALPGGVNPVWVIAADIDGDGDSDLISASTGSQDLRLHFNGK